MAAHEEYYLGSSIDSLLIGIVDHKFSITFSESAPKVPRMILAGACTFSLTMN